MVRHYHQIHDSQIIYSTRFGLNQVSISGRSVLHIATALAVRESVFVVIFDVTFTFLPLVLVYTKLVFIDLVASRLLKTLVRHLIAENEHANPRVAFDL